MTSTYYLLTKTDQSRVKGPIGLGWFVDFDTFARDPNTHKFRSDTACIKVQNLEELVDTVLASLELTDAANTDNEPSKTERAEKVKKKIEETEKDIASIHKIYTIAYSATRIRGWAMVFNIKDMKALCNDTRGDFLPRSWCKSWELQEKSSAVAWLNNEIQLSNTRIQNRKLLKAQETPNEDKFQRKRQVQHDKTQHKKSKQQ
eukprot:Blabericola_migrator_1__8201@NODE_4242_length_1262_cov_47_265272_g2623_i0_p1_GENE_NODE_4242_length_1262_cov_47_265272_g2623_i0NODE_4242_length_1262_cov_47_265272_g2623_i0_p1_ORF_typecomplete_len203_score27_94ZapA/PF05164_13/0_82ZapA/PF05164_13/14_NODE_4242_length_1262_cov_47_265272_g2623_i062670